MATVLGPNRRPIMDDPRYTTYFRLHREFDRTGVVLLGVEGEIDKVDTSKQLVLTPDTSYTVRMGTLNVDDAFPNTEIVSDEEIQVDLPTALRGVGPHAIFIARNRPIRFTLIERSRTTKLTHGQTLTDPGICDHP